jgi:general secretion pathway protein F
MAIFAYQGLNSEGRSARGIVEADSARAARARLRQKGIYPSEVCEDRATAPALRWLPERHLRLAELAGLSRQLATLVGSGMPVVPSLVALEEQVERPFVKKVVAGVRAQVNEGRSLSSALGNYPHIFPEHYRNLVAAGEASGKLDQVLVRLAELLERQRLLRNKIMAALLYPCLMAVVGSAILLTLLAYVVPRVVRVFQESHQLLPWPTRLLVALSDFAASYGPWMAIVLAGLVWSGLRWSRGGRPRRTRDAWLLRLPLLGRVLQRLVSARFARNLSLMLASGVPLVGALRMVAEVMVNQAAAEALREAADEVGQGAALAPALRSSGLFPPVLVHMVAAGEQSGELEQVLARSAQSYESDVEAVLSGLTGVVEPLLIVAMGCAVGFIVLAILWPIFEMNQLIHL